MDNPMGWQCRSIPCGPPRPSGRLQRSDTKQQCAVALGTRKAILLNCTPRSKSLRATEGSCWTVPKRQMSVLAIMAFRRGPLKSARAPHPKSGIKARSLVSARPQRTICATISSLFYTLIFSSSLSSSEEVLEVSYRLARLLR